MASPEESAAPAGAHKHGVAIRVRSQRDYVGKQGLTYTEGVFAENTGGDEPLPPPAADPAGRPGPCPPSREP